MPHFGNVSNWKCVSFRLSLAHLLKEILTKIGQTVSDLLSLHVIPKKMCLAPLTTYR